jgi:hypothetical protein
MSSPETIEMRPVRFGAVILACSLAFGCGGTPPKSDPVVPIVEVPPSVMDVARKELPGFTFDTVYKMKIEGKDAYEIRGKDQRGKVREVEVSAEGEVIAIE